MIFLGGGGFGKEFLGLGGGFGVKRGNFGVLGEGGLE